MATTEEKNPNPTTAIAGANLPAVIDDKAISNRVFLHQDKIIIILSDRFNELSKEKFISPSYGRFEEFGVKSNGCTWNPEKREVKYDQDVRNGFYWAVMLTFKDSVDLDTIVKNGVQNTLMPIMAEIETDMELQLEAEITRLQSLASCEPKI